MFSVDYPFEQSKEAGDWIGTAPLSDDERVMVCRDNAVNLLKL